MYIISVIINTCEIFKNPLKYNELLRSLKHINKFMSSNYFTQTLDKILSSLSLPSSDMTFDLTFLHTD
jgi:hypothetical protein